MTNTTFYMEDFANVLGTNYHIANKQGWRAKIVTEGDQLINFSLGQYKDETEVENDNDDIVTDNSYKYKVACAVSCDSYEDALARINALVNETQLGLKNLIKTINSYGGDCGDGFIVRGMSLKNGCVTLALTQVYADEGSIGGADEPAEHIFKFNMREGTIELTAGISEDTHVVATTTAFKEVGND